MTLLIVIITSVVSIMAFQNSQLIYRYQFNAYQIYHRKQWYRIITHAFLHANWEHLIVNMLVLFSFGKGLEHYFYIFFGKNVMLLYLGLYFGGIIISSVFSLIKQKDNFNYNALGASGAVSAVTFACIFFNPLNKVWFFGILPLPGILFGVLYLGYSYYMSKRNIDNIGHDAHFWGAVFGFVYPIILNPSLLGHFFNSLLN